MNLMSRSFLQTIHLSAHGSWECLPGTVFVLFRWDKAVLQCNRVEVSRLVISGRVRPLARSRASLGQQISNIWKEALVACPGGTLMDNLQGYVNKCVLFSNLYS